MTIERRTYLIDNFQVRYHGLSSWQCACAEFKLGGGCRHTREAAGRREAQSVIERRLKSGKSQVLRVRGRR